MLCQRLLVMYAGRVVEAGPVRAIFDRPSHPYTRALLSSVPRIDAKMDRLKSIEGQPPAFWDLPRGCRFAASPPLPYADQRCHEEYPRSFPVESEAHTASCRRLEDPEWQPLSCSRPAA